MWGNITVEANLQSNFNVGFTNMKSDVLIHLTQWQYWWWFWFSLLWAFYYLVILRIVRFRSLKFRPRLATTFRPHGKWGDLVVCVIPVSWCANIISNSNFILKMVEWQSESGLLTVRIRGKQWYWIYKFELKTITDIISIPKNIGRNRWRISTPGDFQTSQDYLQILQLRASNRWTQELWAEILKDNYISKDVQLVSSHEQLKYNFFKNYHYNSFIDTIDSISEVNFDIFKNFFDDSINSVLIEEIKNTNVNESVANNTNGVDHVIIVSENETILAKPEEGVFIGEENPDITSNTNSIFYENIDLENSHVDETSVELNEDEDFLNFDLFDKNILLPFNGEINKNIRFKNKKDYNLDIKIRRVKIENRSGYTEVLAGNFDEPFFSFDIFNNFENYEGSKFLLIEGMYMNSQPVLFTNRLKVIEIKKFISNFFKNFYYNTNIESEIFYNYFDFYEIERHARRSQGTVQPIRLIKYPLSNTSISLNSNDVFEMFRFRFNDIQSAYSDRPVNQNTLLIIRQKKYKRRKKILPRIIFNKDLKGNKLKDLTKFDPKYMEYTFLNQNKIILKNNFDASKNYNMLRKSKNRFELTNLVFSKRLLRTRRTLVLPAHVNITAITNSYDVVHSWFIPGLGLKMDCVPGRATHHTFYIDNVGFYYGQCAEICGRYHHHMPIRICALPFEHFLVWWQKFGLPKMLFTKNFKKFQYNYGFRKYVW